MKRSPVQKFDTQTERATGMARVAGLTTVLAAVALLSACSDMLTLNPNREPVISISPSSFTVYPGDSVTFDSGDTTDPDDQELEVQWEVVSAPTGSTYFLDDITSFSPTFVSYFRNVPGSDPSDRYVVGPEDYSVPNYLGDYTIRKTVTDEYGVARSSEVTVTVANAAPGADAGSNQFTAVAVDGSLALSGTGGGNEESSRRNTWQYRWVVDDQPHGSQFSLTDPDAIEWASDGGHWTDPSDPDAGGTASATFVPESGGGDLDPGEGVYTLRLRVRDEYGAISQNTIIVETTNNTAPGLDSNRIISDTIANPVAGVTQGIWIRTKTTGPDHVISTNAEADTLTARWTLGAHEGLTTPITLWINGTQANYNIGAQLESEDVARDVPGFGGIDSIEDLEVWPESGTLAFLDARDTIPGTPPADWNIRIDLTVSDGVSTKDDTVYIYLEWTP